MKKLIFVFIICLIGSINILAQNHTSQYAGEEQRDIKSLSAEDVEQLEAGKGWGLAKAAELNGVPGPSHILDMASEISLDENQEEQIKVVFHEMEKSAIIKGKELVKKEAELNRRFSKNEFSISSLKELTEEIGKIRGELMYIHLEAHLRSASILSEQQVSLYNELRGYNNSLNPCDNVPEGHDAKVWKQHNNCVE